MSYPLSEEQKMIRAMARDFAREVLMPTAAERDRTAEFPREIFNQMGELGFMGMMVPEKYGGVGLDTVSYCLALREIASACASTAVVMSVHNSVVCGPINQFGTEAQKKTVLSRLAKGEIIGCFALTEPEAGSDPASQKTTAVKDGDAWVLNGTKRFITSGQNGGLCIATALTDKKKRHRGISAFLIETDNPGYRVGKIEDKLGLRASDTAEIILEDCRVPASMMLGQEGMGFTIAMAALDGGRIGIASQSVGVARSALDQTVTYVKQRIQFGRPIASNQALRFRLADMATRIEAAWLMTLSAAAQRDRSERYSVAASMAKLFASELVNQVVYDCLQMHGGYGYVKDFPIERLYRDARVFTIYEGTSEIQRVIIANQLLGRPD